MFDMLQYTNESCISRKFQIPSNSEYLPDSLVWSHFIALLSTSISVISFNSELLCLLVSVLVLHSYLCWQFVLSKLSCLTNLLLIWALYPIPTQSEKEYLWKTKVTAYLVLNNFLLRLKKVRMTITSQLNILLS